jgi:hypothetical protein
VEFFNLGLGGGMRRERMKRRVPVGKSLWFDYEVSPHRAFLEKTEGTANASALQREHAQAISAAKETTLGPAADGADTEVGVYVPFKQTRLAGQANPLRPPHHVETVLIGRALGQHTGYLLGVGFRIRDDGFVEAEFNEGVRKFDSYEKFSTQIRNQSKRG